MDFIYRFVRYNVFIMENQKKRRGRPSIDATVKCTVNLEPEIHDWAMRQTRTLSATVRHLLAKEREEQERPTSASQSILSLKAVATPRLEEMAMHLFYLDDSDQDLLISVARSMAEKTKKALAANEAMLITQALIKMQQADGT